MRDYRNRLKKVTFKRRDGTINRTVTYRYCAATLLDEYVV